jgi:hypothetical protein
MTEKLGEVIRNGLGETLPEHHCAQRHERARVYSRIIRLQDGRRIAWQFVGAGQTLSIAIRFCPFCGIDLFTVGADA